MDPFVEVFDAICSENEELIITGDFNCNLRSKIVSKESRQLKGIFMNYNLKQLVNQATRISRESSTLLDLFATNCPQNIVSVNTASLNSSDHEMVVAVRKINLCNLPQRTVE